MKKAGLSAASVLEKPLFGELRRVQHYFWILCHLADPTNWLQGSNLTRNTCPRKDLSLWHAVSVMLLPEDAGKVSLCVWSSLIYLHKGNLQNKIIDRLIMYKPLYWEWAGDRVI